MSAAVASAIPRRVDHAILLATVALAGAALLSLIVLALTLDDGQRLAASLVFGICLLICSGSSCLYNMLETDWRPLLRRIDHCAIFLLIAGTYTPFVISGIRGPLGLGMLEWVWGLALFGITLKLLLHSRFDRAFVGLYLALGWLLLLEFPAFVAVNTLSALIPLAVGGFAYTIGAAVYARGIGPWTGAVWHGCVFAGSLAHFLAVVMLRLTPPNL